MSSTQQQRYLTTREAADYLRMSTRVLLTRAAEGRIKGYHPDGRWRFDVNDLDDYMTTGSNSIAEAASLQRRRRRRGAA